AGTQPFGQLCLTQARAGQQAAHADLRQQLLVDSLALRGILIIGHLRLGHTLAYGCIRWDTGSCQRVPTPTGVRAMSGYRSFLLRLGTMTLALTGVLAFWMLSLPLPFLFGPMAFCLIAALAGAPLRGPGEITVAARTILGVAVGASITPEVVSQIPQMAKSVALIPLYVLIIG